MKDKIRVLFICPSLSVKGGISTVVKDYLDSSLSKKYKISQISSHRDGNKFVKLLTALSSMITVWMHMVFIKSDIVHIHGSDVISSLRKYFIFKTIEPFSCKVIYHFHGASFMEQYQTKRSWWTSRINYLFEKSDIVICLSEAWAHQIRKIVPTAEIRVMHNAVKIPLKYNNSAHKRSNQIDLLFLGLIGERKGIFDLLKVVRRLKENHHPIKLVIGGNGEIDRLKKEIESLDIGQTVSFLGWVEVEQKVRLFQSSDIYILPSYGEGMPMSILEAMSYGLPVVSTTVGGIPNLVRNGEDGFLVQPGDIDQLTEKVETLIIDRELRMQMGANARQQIEMEFDLDDTIRKVDRIYQNLISERIS